MVILYKHFLYGLLLTVIPVIVHLLLRAKPKKLLFPALRLIQNRRRQNVQRMRLRHILLLLLRMSLIALLALALAQPRVPAADYAPTSGEWGKLLAIGAMIAALYAGVNRFFQRRPAPRQVEAGRRLYLRTGSVLVALVLFLLLVAWPYQQRIAASITQPTIIASDNVPVAAVLLFDTSLSMQYRFESKTRLERAQEIALAHLSNLPSRSRVAISDSSSSDPLRFQIDLAGAQSRIAALTPQPVTRPIDERLLAALGLQRDDQELRRVASESQAGLDESVAREVYIFTDLAASAWHGAGTEQLKKQMEELTAVNVYLIDVGVQQPTNVALTGLNLSDQTLSLGASLTVRGTLETTGFDREERVVEIYIENEAGKLVKQGQSAVQADPATAAQVDFELPPLTGPVRQGELRILSSDPLAFDDVRYFSIRVQPPLDVLLVADKAGSAQYLREALAPTDRVKLGKAPYRCTVVSPAKLPSIELRRYPAVCLVNVSDPGTAAWEWLARYVDEGGGLSIILGDVRHGAYLTEAAQAVLPADLKGVRRFSRPEYFDLQNVTHPLLKKFTDADVGTAELGSVEVKRCWKVEPTAGANVILRYSDAGQSAAIVEKSRGKGRTLMITTPFERNAWNELAISWSFVVLADQMVHYLSAITDNRFNFLAGEEVRIELEPEPRLVRYLLRKPGLQQLPGKVAEGATTIDLQEPDQIGNYQVLGADEDSKFVRGFSVNPRPEESRLTRLTEDELEGLFGKGRYSLSRSIDGLRREVRQGRVGREVLPVLLLLLVMAFAAEHVVANRFYDEGRPTPTS